MKFLPFFGILTGQEDSVRPFLVKALVMGLLVAPLVGLRLTAQGNPEAAKVQNPVEATPESLAAGKRIFQRYCANCHGINAEGGPGNDLIPPAPDLTAGTFRHGSSDGEIFNTIKNGVPPELNMGAWGDQLKDQDIWNVLNYVRSLAKKK
jgi:cbb3-type cytochrome c oxidase subunit III